MKINPDSLTKLYYSIGEVADLFKVNTSLLRYWENEFKELSPRKKRGGIRLYTKDDIAVVLKIFNLTREEGYTIDGAKKALRSKKVTSNSVSDNLKRLESKMSMTLNKLRRVREQLK